MSENTSSSNAPLAPVRETNTAIPRAAHKHDTNGGFRPPSGDGGALINVQPPRREDLQPSYAENLVGESEQGNHGWYGAMSASPSVSEISRLFFSFSSC